MSDRPSEPFLASRHRQSQLVLDIQSRLSLGGLPWGTMWPVRWVEQGCAKEKGVLSAELEDFESTIMREQEEEYSTDVPTQSRFESFVWQSIEQPRGSP